MKDNIRSGKDHLEHRYSHIDVLRSPQEVKRFPNHFLTEIQRAVVEKDLMRLEYFSANDTLTQRDIEPIELFY